MNKEYEVAHDKEILCSIGGDGGFVIKNNCNINNNSCSNLGYDESYELPDGIQPDSLKAISFLAGTNFFYV